MAKEQKLDQELGINELLESVLRRWKLIAVATLLGALIGGAVWWAKGYEVSWTVKPVAGLDYVTWRSIVARLPGLATARLNRSEISDEEDALYRKLSSTRWWPTHVTPQLRYSKNDLRELGTLPKEEQDRGSMIERVVFRSEGRAPDKVTMELAAVERFVREGALLLELRSFIERNDLRVRGIAADVQAKVSRQELELDYLRGRAKLLKKLAQQYPEKQIAGLQTVLDPKGETARYLPLSTQRIAVDREIASVEEALSRLYDTLQEANVWHAFIERALPLLDLDTDGVNLAQRLTEIEADVRENVDASSKAQFAAINEIARELNAIHQRFSSLFESGGSVVMSRPSFSVFITLGLLAGGMVGVLALLVITMWSHTRGALEPKQAEVTGGAG